jgi:hypothetical protein
MKALLSILFFGWLFAAIRLVCIKFGLDPFKLFANARRTNAERLLCVIKSMAI